MELNDLIRITGNNFKLVQRITVNICYYDLKKYNFTNRVIAISYPISYRMRPYQGIDRLTQPRVSRITKTIDRRRLEQFA